MVVHDITKIFITPASKSRQTDDKHACGWVSFLWFEIHHTTYAHACLYICDVICDRDLLQTSTFFFLTDWLFCGFFPLLDSANTTCQWSTALIRATKIYFHQDASPQNLSHPPCLCLPGKYFFHFAHVKTESISVYYFYTAVFNLRVLMIIHETEFLPKDGGAITSPSSPFDSIHWNKDFLTFSFFFCLSQQSSVKTASRHKCKAFMQIFPLLLTKDFSVQQPQSCTLWDKKSLQNSPVHWVTWETCLWFSVVFYSSQWHITTFR